MLSCIVLIHRDCSKYCEMCHNKILSSNLSTEKYYTHNTYVMLCRPFFGCDDILLTQAWQAWQDQTCLISVLVVITVWCGSVLFAKWDKCQATATKKIIQHTETGALQCGCIQKKYAKQESRSDWSGYTIIIIMITSLKLNKWIIGVRLISYTKQITECI